MDTIYFDWGGGKVTTLKNNSNKVIYYSTLDELMNTLTKPTNLIGEATFESFDIFRRKDVIERAIKDGHTILNTPNRLTGRHRRAMGYNDDEKTDELDVTVIRDLAKTRPNVLKTPNVRMDDDPLVSNLEAANAELMILRRTRRMVKNKSAIGFKTVTAKDDYADTLISYLPDYKTLTDIQKKILGDEKKYAKVLVAAAGKATKFSSSRREYEHYAGLHVHGYPSQIRSDFHHWRWRFAKKKDGVTISDFRRECRWLYHRLNEHRDVL